MNNVFSFLKRLNIDYEVFDHPAVFTVEDTKKYPINAVYGESKNLFLKNRKENKYYLVTLPAQKQLDLKNLATVLGEKGLSFANEENLMNYLGLSPGAVSPFGLINDINHEVIFVIENNLLEHKKLGFHPNINIQTVILATDDFKKFIASTNNQIIYLNL